MFKFSQKSLDKLQGIDARLVEILNEAIKQVDFVVLEGLRTYERQVELYNQGRSKTLNSKHLTGKAVDIAPYPIDWNDKLRFEHLATIIKQIAKDKGYKITWGGDWKSFKDMPHYQIE
jgi:peptidoglycan L-alanyl-D-glutamate endopeptidase CwlK